MLNAPHLAEPESIAAPLRVLRVDASARREGAAGPSVTRGLADALLARLDEVTAGRRLEVTVRDVSVGLPVVDEAWVAANFTDAERRTPAQRAALAHSDALVAELQAADVVIIGAPVYNFGIPASLKAWIDLVARARLTFRYTEAGVEGLLRGKRACLVMASGGTPIGSDIDFASTYLRHVLGFLGITDVEVLGAERLMARGEDGVAQAHGRIAAVAEALGRAGAQVAAHV